VPRGGSVPSFLSKRRKDIAGSPCGARIPDLQGTRAWLHRLLRAWRGKMVFKRDGQIVESAREARQAERGPTVRNLLLASTALAIIALSIVWLVFFKT
jgi:hypothetical protein